MTTLTVPKSKEVTFIEDELELVVDALDYYMQHNIKVMPRPLSDKISLSEQIQNILTKLY